MRFCAAAARASWVAKRTLVPNASRTEAYRCCSQHAGPDASEIDPGLEQLISLARFHEASQVFDYGCGTGRLIGRLLRQENPGLFCTLVDISEDNVEIARERLRPLIENGQVTVSNLTTPNGSRWGDQRFDRFTATYVLDFLEHDQISDVLTQAHAVLKPGEGQLCYAGIAPGIDPIRRATSDLWAHLHSRKHPLFYHRRPISICDFLDPALWRVLHRVVVCPFLLCNEIVIAVPVGHATED